MRIVLIILAVIASLFLLNFIFWYIYAAVTDKKRTERYTKHIISSLPKFTVIQLSIILKEYDAKNVEEVNKLVQHIYGPTFDKIIDLLHPENRPKEFSAGKLGNQMAWSAWLSRLKEEGYNEKASKLIAVCYINHLQDTLIQTEINDILES